MRKRIVSVMMIFFIGLWLGGCFETVRTSLRKSKLRKEELNNRKSELESQIKNIDQTLLEVDAEIVKHQQNVKKMKQRLKEAKEKGTSPDVSGTEAIATASGSRSEAFRKSPAWKKDLINKFENMQVYNAWDAARLASSAVDGDPNAMHLDIEINRSNRFIRMLRVFRKKQEDARTKAGNELQRINKELSQYSTTITDQESNGGGNGGGY